MSGNPVLSDPTSQADSSSTSGNTDTSESTSLSTKRTSSNALENDNNEKNKKLKESVKSPKRLAHVCFKQLHMCIYVHIFKNIHIEYTY